MTSMIFDSLRKARNQPLLKQDRPTLGEMRVLSALYSASGHDKEFWDYTKSKHNEIKINGVDKELVSKIAADIINLKPVEPYKAKGIKEKGQFVLRKEGKKK